MSADTSPVGAVPPSTPPVEHPDMSPKEQQRARLEDKIEQLLQSLLEVGICTSDVQETAREGYKAGGAQAYGPGGLLGKKVNESIGHMAALYDLNRQTDPSIAIPVEVVNHVDQGANPDRWLKTFIERAAHENMYTNGIVSNTAKYHALLSEQLFQNFPNLRTAAAESLHDGPTGMEIDRT